MRAYQDIVRLHVPMYLLPLLMQVLEASEDL